MKEVKYESARLWRASIASGVFAITAAFVACAAPATAVLPDSQTSTALTTTTDLDAAEACLETYVSCVRDAGTTCKDDLVACWQSAQTTTADASGDAGTARPPRGDGGGGGRGTCTKREKGDPAKAKGMREPPAGCVKRADSCATGKKKTCAKCADEAVQCVVDDANGTPATTDDASTGDDTTTSTAPPESTDPPAESSDDSSSNDDLH